MFIPLYDDNPLTHLPRPYVNYALIGLNVLAFFLSGGFHEAVDPAAVAYGFIPSVVDGYEVVSPQQIPAVLTFITYSFLHVGWLHLLGNMAFLWVFGDNVEDALGHVRYLLFYLICAAAAAFVHSLIYPQSPAPLIGASGAVSGVVGAYLVLHPRVKLWILLLGRIPLRLSAMWVLGGWIVFQVFNVVVAAEGDSTAWWAHIGGLAVGAGLVILFRRPGVALLDRNLPKPG